MAISKVNDEKLCVFLVVAIICQIYTYIADVSDYGLSLIYCLTSFFSLKLIWDFANKKITLFFLFLVAYHLFIGGRFFLYLFSQDKPIFLLYSFTHYEPQGIEKLNIFLFVYMFVVFSTIGFCIGHRKERKIIFVPKLTKFEDERIDKLLNKLAPLFIVFLLYYSYDVIMTSLQNIYGTIALETNAEDNISYLAKFARLSISTLAGVALAYGKKKTMLKYMAFLAVIGIVNLIGGSRGAFGSFVLFFVWAYSLYKSISITKLVIYGGIGLATLLILFSFSSRAITSGFVDLSPIDALKDFSYGNGISLMVFGVSMTISNYPIYPYLQQLFLGSNFIISHLAGIQLKPEEVSFQGHLCNMLDSQLFYSGAGLGWTGNGDIYLFAGGSIIMYCILSYFIGRLISYIDASSRKSPFYLFMAGAIGYGLFTVPRGSYSALFVMFYYVYIYFFIIKFLTRFVSIKKSQV